jgi:hypothetical protein
MLHAQDRAELPHAEVIMRSQKVGIYVVDGCAGKLRQDNRRFMYKRRFVSLEQSHRLPSNPASLGVAVGRCCRQA